MTRIAQVAKGYQVRVSAIQHSGKKRAEQTAEILASALSPPGGAAERSGIAPLDDVVPVAQQMTPNADLMLVGHLPFSDKLVSYLITGSAEPSLIRFQNGGIVCLEIRSLRRDGAPRNVGRKQPYL